MFPPRHIRPVWHFRQNAAIDGGSSLGPGSPFFAYEGAFDTQLGATSVNFTNVPIGTPSTTRLIVVGGCFQGNAAGTYQVSMGGIALPLIISDTGLGAGTTNGTGTSQSNIFAGVVQSGATATMNLTCGPAGAGEVRDLFVFVLDGLASNTQKQTALGNGFNILCDHGDTLIMAAAKTSGTFTVTGETPTTEDAVAAGGFYRAGHVHTIATAGTGNSLACGIGGGVVLVGATWK